MNPTVFKRAPFRDLALDALRGLAIIGMVFSGVFPHESPWPSWMFHAQVGPPSFTYTPEVAGITWVDLVFPFFLFSMGAAFPLAMNKRLENKQYFELIQSIVKRGALLVFFAIAIRYLNPYWLKGAEWVNLLTALTAFTAFFLVFMRFKVEGWKKYAIQGAGILVIVLLIYFHSLFTENSFSKAQNDIIILVLANVAVFGAFIWILTYQNWLLRMGILAIFAAIWITYQIPGSWTKVIWDFHPSIRWFYNFSFLKYLCIVLPGSVMGDILLQYHNSSNERKETIQKGAKPVIVALIALLFILVNLYTLFTRQINLCIGLNFTLGVSVFLTLRKANFERSDLYKILFNWAFFFIVLGLFLEPIDGGIKKDPSSFSYWFLTSGLAFITYILCDILGRRIGNNVFWKSLIQSGQNPMIAYVSNSFLLIPILGLLQLLPVFDFLRDQHVYLGLVRAIVITGLVLLTTSFFTKKRWFWRT